MTLGNVLQNWGNFKDIENLGEQYFISATENIRGEKLIIDPGTYSGLRIFSNGEMHIVVSGVSYDQYYEPEKLKLKKEDKVKSVYNMLVKKEKINKDRFTNVFNFLYDVSRRDADEFIGRVKEELEIK